MLATVSPAADNYHETLSTLRYADSAKRIVNQAVVNEDVKFKAIEELQEEIKRLRLQLTTTEQVKEAEVQELKAQLEEKECLLRDLETSWEEKLKRTEVATQEWRKNLEKMGVTLNKQDVVFSNQCYLIQPGAKLIIHNLEATTKVGSGPSQDIQISGAECEHCIIRKTKDGEVFLNPNGNSKTYVNGFLAEAMTQIWHEDKIQLGTNVFILHLPDRPNPGHRKEDVSRETDVQMYGELNIENDRLSITSGIYSRNGSLIGDEKSKTIEGLTQTVPASNEDFSCSENKHISDMFTQISDGTNSQLTDVSVNTTRNTESEYLEIGVGTQVQNRMIQCPPGYGETSYETSASLKSSHLFWNVPDLGNHITLPSSGKEKNSQGIFCWDKDIDLQWLTDLLPRTSISAASVCCISHPPGDYWKFEVQKFSPIILCHSFTTMAKWTQLEEFLKHCIDTCGKRVIVIMVNVIDSEFEEKVRSDWRKWKFSGCDLITLTRQEMDAVGTYRSGLRRAMTEKIKMLKEILRLSTERIPVSWPWQMFQVKKANIGIFSRSSGDDYSWLVKLLRSADFRDWVQSVTPYYISNNGYQRFRDDVSQCTFGILYHTKNGGSINMIDGTDYLYEEELKYLHDRLGKNNVIMLIDDVEDDNLEKGWIFENQSGALGFVRDLFLISHNEKLSKFDLQHKINLEQKLAQLECILKGNSTQLGFSQ